MSQLANNWFHDVVSALAYSLATPHQPGGGLAPYNDLTQFILAQHRDLPDYLRAPMRAMALGFDTSGLPKGKPFHRQSPETRAKQIAAWKSSNISVQRDLIRYFDSLATLALYGRAPADQIPPSARLKQRPQDETPQSSALRAEIVVIGSGPGGAITACLLAEAGRDVLLIEEGAHLPLDSCEPFTKEEMLQKYRNGGQTVALGKNKIQYVEGRCVGGGSEINSGLYHRTPPEILARWRKEFRVEGLDDADLTPHFIACERDLSVSPLPHEPPPASLKLLQGAKKMGWQALEVPRWFRYHLDPDRNHLPHESQHGKRQSMTETFIPRFLKAGGQLVSGTRALRFYPAGNGWHVETHHQTRGPIVIAADTLFLCAGAIHTPTLLRRSGITRNIGNTLQCHPTVKIVAEFPETVNRAGMGVPVHQVKEFSPRISFGCSISSPGYVALGLIDYPSAARETAATWQRRAIYYAMTASEGRGTIRALPHFRDPLVRYRLEEADRRNLAEGLMKLSQLLFASGATTLYPSLTRGQPLRSPDNLKTLPEILPDGLASLMTIHLMASCPMGENRELSATDSFGRVHGFKNLFVNDASLLCTAPGLNPQGSIMAIARRNALAFLQRLS